MRLELLGLSFTVQHSDARVLEQIIYKFDHTRRVLAPCWPTAMPGWPPRGWETIRGGGAPGCARAAGRRLRALLSGATDLDGRASPWRFPRPTLLMGVVNVTPDSFFDGGRHFALEEAVRARAGAGGTKGRTFWTSAANPPGPARSPWTRPRNCGGCCPWSRPWPAQSPAAVSIDTQKPAWPAPPSRPGPVMVNDIAANRDDPAMGGSWRRPGAGYVCMHMQGTPQTMQSDPVYADVVAEVDAFFARTAGVAGGRGGGAGARGAGRGNRLRQDARAQFAVARRARIL